MRNSSSVFSRRTGFPRRNMQERFIIHLNVADFAAAVERVMQPRLRGRPLVIAPEGIPRAVVYDMSEEAYRQGVRKEMSLRKALRRCPGAAVLSPHPDRYERAMRHLLECALPYSPLVEASDSRGHLFLDVTGTGRLFGPPPDVAWRIRKSVRSAMGLDPIWSVAPNKLTAKVATRIVKPTGEYIIGAGEEEAFLAPLPLHLIPGIESDDLKRFSDFNLTLVREAARLSEEQLLLLFEGRGISLYEALHGIDPSPVRPFTQKPPVVALGHVFDTDAQAPVSVEGTLSRLVGQAGSRLRKQRLAAARIRVALDYSDGIRSGRQAAVAPASANDFRLFPAAEALLHQAWKRRVRVRRLILVCDRLTDPPPVQQDLFSGNVREKIVQEHLLSAMDAVRDRFGNDALCIGRMLAA